MRPGRLLRPQGVLLRNPTRGTVLAELTHALLRIGEMQLLPIREGQSNDKERGWEKRFCELRKQAHAEDLPPVQRRGLGRDLRDLWLEHGEGQSTVALWG